MTYTIKIEKAAFKSLKKLPPKEQSKIKETVDSLKTNPHSGKAMVGRFKGLHRIRVGNYRIVYAIKNDILVVLVLLIGHRKDIYR